MLVAPSAEKRKDNLFSGENHSFLEHCIQSEKEFPDLTDDDTLVGFQNEHDELSSQKEQNLVTEYLKEISEEFYVIDPPDSRPLKIVIKGLPISTEIGEIQEDLTSQGFSVEKVAQLTRSKTKSPLPIFMVELEKKPDSLDIFKMKKCCCLTVQVDAFNRRPGVLQCYNCNLFNHSSKNCFMHTRCLKCGKSHRTNECLIKERIQNPVCINCNKTGHMANWSQCKEFPRENCENWSKRDTLGANSLSSTIYFHLILTRAPDRRLRHPICYTPRAGRVLQQFKLTTLHATL
ncbi:nucleic-acid-binding protein from transposon X-element [Trichonephila clavipes]|nr:nucleic-acid-binding protein from transposon X-element [Trichonephila clavipes]